MIQLKGDLSNKHFGGQPKNDTSNITTDAVLNDQPSAIVLNNFDLMRKDENLHTLWRRGNLNCRTPYKYDDDNIRPINCSKTFFLTQGMNSLKLSLSNVMNSDTSEEEIGCDNVNEKLFERCMSKTLSGWDDYGIHYLLSNIDSTCKSENILYKDYVPSIPGSSFLHIHACDKCLDKIKSEYNFYSALPLSKNISENSYHCYNAVTAGQNNLPLLCSPNCCPINDRTNDCDEQKLKFVYRNSNGEEEEEYRTEMKCSEQYFRRIVYSYNSCGLNFKFPEETEKKNSKFSRSKTKIIKRNELLLNPNLRVVVYGTDPCALNFPVELGDTEEDIGNYNELNNDCSSNSILKNNSIENVHSDRDNNILKDCTMFTDGELNVDLQESKSTGSCGDGSRKTTPSGSGSSGSDVDYLSITESNNEFSNNEFLCMPVQTFYSKTINNIMNSDDEEYFYDTMNSDLEINYAHTSTNEISVSSNEKESFYDIYENTYDVGSDSYSMSRSDSSTVMSGSEGVLVLTDSSLSNKLKTSDNKISTSSVKLLPRLPTRLKQIYRARYPYNGKLLVFSIYERKIQPGKRDSVMYYQPMKRTKRKKRPAERMEYSSSTSMKIHMLMLGSESNVLDKKALSSLSGIMKNEKVVLQYIEIPLMLQACIFIMFFIFFIIAFLLIEDTMHFAKVISATRLLEHDIFGLFG